VYEEFSMAKIVVLISLISLTALGGCSLANQSFSCEAGISPYLIDANPTPPIRDASGYLHC
jgi:hypothetical protein